MVCWCVAIPWCGRHCLRTVHRDKTVDHRGRTLCLALGWTALSHPSAAATDVGTWTPDINTSDPLGTPCHYQRWRYWTLQRKFWKYVFYLGHDFLYGKDHSPIPQTSRSHRRQTFWSREVVLPNVLPLDPFKACAQCIKDWWRNLCWTTHQKDFLREISCWTHIGVKAIYQSFLF